MSILCKLFGHKTPTAGYSQYGRFTSSKAIDGIGREHAEVQYECLRCEEYISICMVHLPKRFSELELERRCADLEKTLKVVANHI
jgi:hypothetical protein